MEEAYSQSFVTGDTRIAARLVLNDFVGFEPNGKTSEKAAILADVGGQPRPTSLKITGPTVRLHNGTAIALGTEEDTNAGTTKVTHRRWLDTWISTTAGWRLAASAELVPLPKSVWHRANSCELTDVPPRRPGHRAAHGGR